MSKGKKVAAWTFGTLTVVILAAIALGAGTFLKILQKSVGEHTGGGQGSLLDRLKEAQQVAIEPKEGFPGKDRIVILCMGIDDNWTDKDEVYTAGARTDTLFLLTLDLNTHTATMLSIPRDTYAHIAGTANRYFKINEAYSTGGPLRAVATVDELLGVHADHYMVLNIDATKKMVAALGGVDVNVEHPMHYDDNWGHLHVDLKPGFQHLGADEAVGFARYRHGNTGTRPTPEDGDERRMYRQHVLLRAMVAKAKSFANVAQAPQLIDVAMSTIHTDLTRTQLFDLAALYRGIQPEGIQTASIPGDSFRGPNGEWFYRLEMDQAKIYTDWLVRGDETAARRLVAVVVKNGTDTPGLAQRVVDMLKTNGYTNVSNGGNALHPTVHLTAAPMGAVAMPARSSLLDTGVPNPKAAQDVASLLGLTNAVEERRTLKPNHVGWTPEPTLTVTLGQDYAQAVKDSGVVNATVAPSAPVNQN